MRHRVFLADDHPIVRHGLQQLLDNQFDLTVVGQAENGLDVLSQPHKENWDVLVLDLSLPGVSGVEVLRKLRRDHPKLKVVILSMYPEEQYAAQMLAEGASAYVSKSLPPEEFLSILRHVLRFGRYVSEAVPLESKAKTAGETKPLHSSLTAREYQVFTLIYQGKTVTEVAAELAVSASTVSNHLARIKEKLVVHSVGEVVAYAHRAGLID